MEPIQTRPCRQEQAAVLRRNTGRVLQFADSWWSVLRPYCRRNAMAPDPRGECSASIERLDRRPDDARDAEPECRRVVATLFPHLRGKPAGK